MAQNDLTGAYLDERQSATLTPDQQLQRRSGKDPARVEAKEIFQAGVEKTGTVAAKATKDIFRGAIEAPLQVVGGITDAGREAGEALTSLFDFFHLPTTVQITNEQGELDFDLITGKELKERGGQFVAEAAKVGEPTSVSSGLVRGVSQFLTGFLPTVKALKLAPVVQKGLQVAPKVAGAVTAMTAGAITDLAVFDPHEERFSDLVQKFPALQNPVTEFLQADVEDSEALGRFKNAIEGLGMGGITDGFIHATRGIKANRLRKLEAGEIADEKALIDTLADDAPAKVEKFVPFDQVDEAPLFKLGKKKAGEERALNINTAKLETTDDVIELIEGVGKTFSKDINKARREVITREQTEALADDLGMTVETLLERRQGEAFNAEQALSARKILVSSGENLMNLAKTAQAGSEIDLIKFRKALDQHRAIQLQVSGATAEAGRALQSFNIKAGSSAEQMRLINEALEASGGENVSKLMAKKLGELEGVANINTYIEQASRATTKEMVYEAWINGLLSSPATHAVNILSNSLTAVWAVGERKIASLIGASIDRQSVPAGEATAQLWGMVKGARDGWALAWDSLKTGEPADVITKMEVKSHRAISAENLQLTGTAGRSADFIGSAVRTPGRLLIASDEFFKSVGYRMELHAQAFRQATGEGLKGDDLAKRMNEIIQDPPENITFAAIDASRYQTFTKPLAAGGKAVQKLTQAVPALRVIIPFIRTPVNIMKYAGERTPVAFASKAIRAEIASGGARRDMALAKMATGSMIMATAADLTMSGTITGSGPADYNLRNIKRATGWQPHSIKIGDTYISYDRLDPVGATIGMAADLTEILGQIDEFDAVDVSVAAVSSIAKNITSKTYLRGVSEAFETLGSLSDDPDAENPKARRWLERFVGSAVPAGVAQLERTLSPEMSSTQGIIEKLRSRIPGFSKDLPPRRNIYGEPVYLEGGIGPDIMSPLYKSTDKKDKISDEIVAQQTLIRMPRKTINGVPLSTKEYDKYILLYAGKNNRFVDKPLRSALREMMASPQYKTATDGQEGGKSMLIRSVFEGYRDAAKQAMIEETPKLKREIRQGKEEKAAKLGFKL